MDINSYIYEEDFEEFCRERFEKVSLACQFLGIANDETYEDFKERNYVSLELEYRNSIDKTMH
tara:strand:- start:1793 stop:1981 length:189 start_codon:yes stop_codon:yes gene_type:complete